MTAVLALFRQDGPNLVDLGEGRQGPIRPAMAGSSAHLSPALLAPAALPRLTGQSVGGRRLRRVRRVLLAQRQLTPQICDLLLLIGYLIGLVERICCSLSASSRRSRSFSRSRSLACGS